MSNSDSHTGYTTTARLLHWLIAGMIVLQFVLAKLAERADSQDYAVRQLALLANHKSVGITIFFLVVIRLAWRALHTPPALPDSTPRWQVNASRVSHGLLYTLIILLPVTGWLMSSASAYSVSWFGLAQLPDLLSANPDLKEVFEEIHETLAKVLFFLALLHILAALKHALIDRDNVLKNMLSFTGLVAFVATVVAGVALLGSTGNRAADSGTAPAGSDTPETSSINEAASTLPSWNIDYAKSYIRFRGSQAGATFDGEWLSWSAVIKISKTALDDGVFDVTVNTAEVSTNDAERDATLADADWFNVMQYPVARFQSNRFTIQADNRVKSDGQLVIKGKAVPVSLEFSLIDAGQSRNLRGTATLLRLEHDVGTGEWRDTTAVANEVIVEFYVEQM